MAFHEIQWYDRNPQSRVGDYTGQNIGPHIPTERVAYTCPSDKIAMVEIITNRLIRRTVAAPADIAEAYMAFIPNGEAPGFLLRARVLTNNVGDKDDADLGTTMMMYAGDQMIFQTVDTSTGGSFAYNQGYKLTEFDAYLYVSPPKTVPEPIGEDVQSALPRPDPVM